MSTTHLSESSAVEQSTQPFEDLVPRDSDIAQSADGLHLIGSECRACGAKNFPRRMACFHCGGVDLADCELAAEGVLYSHTTVHVSASRATPYHLAYIDLADGVRVLADVSDAAIEAGIDSPVVLAATDGGWRFESGRHEPASAA